MWLISNWPELPLDTQVALVVQPGCEHVHSAFLPGSNKNCFRIWSLSWECFCASTIAEDNVHVITLKQEMKDISN